MRMVFHCVVVLAMLVFSAPAWASLPHYNANIGYTIWLPKDWSVAPDSYLKWAGAVRKSLPAQDTVSDWEAGYFSPTGTGGRSLLVEIKHGRKMHAADISNFNRFLVRSLHRKRAGIGSDDFRLRDATYFKDKKTLRLETEIVRERETVLSLTYIVYTRKGMLTFVGYLDPADVQAKQTLDKAVLSVYLDDSIRY